LLSSAGGTVYTERMERITCLGETNFHNQHKRFGIQQADRRHHTYIIGRNGTGKSTLIANLVRQDFIHHGLALLDPHGDLVEKLARSVPEARRSDLIYFNASDPASALAFNPLELTPSTPKPLVASGLIAVFKKIWPETWGPRLVYILRNVLLALLDLPGSTLLDVPRLLDDAEFRSYVLASQRGISSSSVFLFFARNCCGGLRVLGLMEEEAGRTEYLAAQAAGFCVVLADLNSAVGALFARDPRARKSLCL
jgi:hypothetical protein